MKGIRTGAMLHDIGKLYVPAEILTKPGRLSGIEFELVKNHAEVGYEILKDIEFQWPVPLIVRQHHERLDGSGYPAGLKADDILFEARILGVADVVEAISSHRPYRPGLGIECALEEITRARGTAFDPSVVDACLALFRNGFHFS
jgi:putative nucleotidyltransferase with HDIG domain